METELIEAASTEIADLQELEKRLSYDKTSGKFTWKESLGHRSCGREAGSLSKFGYIRIKVFGKSIFAHRLAWLFEHKQLPKGQIDHIDGNRASNKISNLRDVDQVTNMQNRKAQTNSQTGLLGSHPNGKLWKALIKLNGKDKYLGTFKSPELAHQAYLAEKRLVHAGCTI